MQVKSTLDSAMLAAPSHSPGRGIHWGGTLQQRADFLKRRDQMQEWAEYLFRN